MVLEFLRAERDTIPAWGREIVDNANVEDASENDLRKQLLARRGYPQREALFTHFPPDVASHHAELTVPDLASVRYMDRDQTWLSFSEGTRSIPHGVSRLGKLSFRGDPSPDIYRIAAAVEEGRSFPDLILVGPPDAAPEQLVILEGHKRATAYVYGEKPAQISVLVGFSSRIGEWYWF